MITETAKEARDYLAVALDAPDLADATRIAEVVQPHVGVAKVGLELFSAAGRQAIATMVELGFKVFLDVKLHDIPTTVNKAAKVLGEYGASFVTLHSVGGEDMLRAGIEGLAEGAAKAGNPAPIALAVTVLTSEKTATEDEVKRRLALAVAAGCPGVICAAPDLGIVKSEAPEIFAVTPGIRPAGTPTHDQKRIATPSEAINDGADLLVIGRAITQSEKPAKAAQGITEEIAPNIR